MDPLTTLRLLLAAAEGQPGKVTRQRPGVVPEYESDYSAYPPPEMRSAPPLLNRAAGSGTAPAMAELPDDLVEAVRGAGPQRPPQPLPAIAAAKPDYPFRAPRRGMFPNGAGGYAEEWKQQQAPGDDSPSDAMPPPGVAGVAKAMPKLPQPGMKADGLHDQFTDQDFQDAHQRMDLLAQRLATLNAQARRPADQRANAGPASMPMPQARGVNPRFYDSQPGIRGEFSGQLANVPEGRSNMPGGLLEMRLNRLKEKPSVAALEAKRFPTSEESSQILNQIRTERLAQRGTAAAMTDKERIAAGWTKSIPTIHTPDGKMAVRLPGGQMVPVKSDEEAKSVIEQFGKSKSDAWQQTMAANEGRDKASLAMRPIALNRLAEHELFTNSPQAWMFWKMMGGTQPGSPAMPEGGGYDKMAMMAHMNGDPDGAKFFGHLYQIQGEQKRGDATMNLAAAQHYGQEMGKWEQSLGQWRATLTQARDAATKRLVERSGDAKYVPSNEAIDAEVRRISPDLLTPPPKPWFPGQGGYREWGGQQGHPGSQGAAAAPAAAGLAQPADSMIQKLRAIHPDKLREHLGTGANIDTLTKLGPDDLNAVLASPNLNRKALIRALWDVYHGPRDQRPGFFTGDQMAYLQLMYDLLGRMGVPLSAMPGRPHGWLRGTTSSMWNGSQIEEDSPAARAYYESLK